MSKDEKLKKNIMININEDDPILNDYLYCWSQMDQRPNKINLHNFYKTNEFLDYIDTLVPEYCGTHTDIIPTEIDYIVNEKTLIKVSQNIYLSYIHFDKDNELGVISDVSFYYATELGDKVNEILENINEFINNKEQEQITNKINTPILTQNGLELDPIDLLKGDYENIDLYFNDDTIKKANKLIKKIKKSNKGLSIIYGERGTGKTTLVNHISSMVDKIVIYIPCNMIELTLNNSDFKSLISRYKNSVLVIDDCEIYFSELHSKASIFTNNLLQLVDGFQSDNFDLNIITILNVDSISEIDHTLMECNNLIDIIEVEYLKSNKVNELCEHLGQKNKYKFDTKLVNILKKKVVLPNKEELGFK